MQAQAPYQASPGVDSIAIVYCFDPKRKNNLYKIRRQRYGYTQKLNPHMRKSQSYKIALHDGWRFGR